MFLIFLNFFTRNRTFLFSKNVQTFTMVIMIIMIVLPEFITPMLMMLSIFHGRLSCIVILILPREFKLNWATYLSRFSREFFFVSVRDQRFTGTRYYIIECPSCPKHVVRPYVIYRFVYYDFGRCPCGKINSEIKSIFENSDVFSGVFTQLRIRYYISSKKKKPVQRLLKLLFLGKNCILFCHFNLFWDYEVQKSSR